MTRDRSRFRLWLEQNSLSLVMFGFFVALIVGQAVAGYLASNQDLEQHGRPPIGVPEYLTSGHFTEAVFENWESEFLQMAAFVILTIFLRQKGSPESKKLVGEEEVDLDPRTTRRRAGVPWPVRRGGVFLWFYERSLSIALLLLFVFSFAGHALGGAAEYNQEQREHGGTPVPASRYVVSARFWYESFQNWQSEFLAVGALVVLSIYLRQRGSPESKPVDHPHHETGSE